ncbi:uncharacterized protein LOC130744509 [Lotus japonicus]|uniref:uncharacterized protein LOC130744509 n=1 Tax=Lotus japonicus TaxID=34305 RepID=UPI002587B091|nr:uncharacterized protein LOC130744509 [Lotus japonicus]
MFPISLKPLHRFTPSHIVVDKQEDAPASPHPQFLQRFTASSSLHPFKASSVSHRYPRISSSVFQSMFSSSISVRCSSSVSARQKSPFALGFLPQALKLCFKALGICPHLNKHLQFCMELIVWLSSFWQDQDFKERMLCLDLTCLASSIYYFSMLELLYKLLATKLIVGIPFKCREKEVLWKKKEKKAHKLYGSDELYSICWMMVL